MKEISETLTRILDKALIIWNDPKQLYPVKDDAVRIFINSLDMVVEAFSPETLARLIREENNRKIIEAEK